MMFQPIDEQMPSPLPYTVEQVVEVLYADLQFRDKVIMANLSEDDLDSSIYTAMAKTIRKEFGLYNGNTDLLNSCCSYIGREYEDHEGPVMVIVKELWKKAKTSHRLHLVERNSHTAAN